MQRSQETSIRYAYTYQTVVARELQLLPLPNCQRTTTASSEEAFTTFVSELDVSTPRRIHVFYTVYADWQEVILFFLATAQTRP
jgi:hypothetical protein